MPAIVPNDQLASVVNAVRDGLRQAPEPPIATFSVESSLKQGYQVELAARQFSFLSDEPEKIGGTDLGPTPVEYVLAGLAACQEIVYATYARVLDIEITSLKVRAEGSLDLRGFFGVADVQAGFSSVTYSVDIDSPAPAEEIRRLIDTVNAKCPVLEIIKDPVPVTSAYALNGEALEVAPVFSAD